MKITNLEKDFMQISVETGKSIGLDTLGSQIFAILYLESEPVSMESIVEKTGYSLTSIFNKLSRMNHMNFVQKIKRPGSKKIFFYLRKDFSEMLKERIILGYEKRIVPLKEKIPNIINKYKKEKLNKKDQQKLKIIEDYNKQITKMEYVMKNMISLMENGK